MRSIIILCTILLSCSIISSHVNNQVNNNNNHEVENKVRNILDGKDIDDKNKMTKNIENISKSKIMVLKGAKQTLADKTVQLAFDPFIFARNKHVKNRITVKVMKLFMPVDTRDIGQRVVLAQNSPLKYKIQEKSIKLLVFSAGFGNIGPSVEYIVRLLRVAEKVVIIYQHPGANPQYGSLQRINEINGFKLPSSMKDRLFVIGEDKRIFLDHEQATDVIINGYKTMHKNKDVIGIQNVFESKSVFIGHSLGSFAGANARRIFKEHGHPNAIGKLITIGGILGMHKLDKSSGAALQGRIMSFYIKAFPSAESIKHLNTFLEEGAAGKHNKFLESLIMQVDVGLATRIGVWNPYVVEPFVRPQYRFVANGMSILEMYRHPIKTMIKGMKSVFGGLRGIFLHMYNPSEAGANSDGSVAVTSQLQGKNTFTINTMKVDHLYQISNYEVVDEIIKHV